MQHNEYLCSVCKGGYFLKEGKCVSCENMIKGCYMCDIFNENKCILCSKNYYMNDKGECIVVPGKEEKVVDTKF